LELIIHYLLNFQGGLTLIGSILQLSKHKDLN
jgi:hypothetical protein